MKLLGIDVGFAIGRDTTGIAFYNEGYFSVWRATTDWKDRSRFFYPEDFKPDTVAIDAPLVGQQMDVVRNVELFFSKQPFQNRCKAGLSHAGMGMELRKAGNATREQVVASGTAGYGKIFEAFPNAFIGILVPDIYYRNMPELKRGRKFDWLYNTAVQHNLFSDLYKLLDVPENLQQAIAGEEDHEHRAAWICLLTAWCVNLNIAKPIGDTEGGWFWMPPQSLWQPWTRQENCQLGFFS